MSNSRLEQLLSTMQTLFFKQIGTKITTNALKSIMDLLFVLFEKIGSKFPVLSDLYLRLYQDIVHKEITLAQITSHDRVLVIGSGALPATPVLIAQNTSAPTHSIDKDCGAVKKAAEFVKNIHLEQILTIECADGLTYPIDQFTVIIVLYGVKHPAKMLRHLSDRINTDTRIIYRTITDSQGRVTDKTLNLSDYFKIKAQVHTETLGSFDSFLLTKKQS